MSEESKICPFKNLELALFPTNYCEVKSSYCTWPCDYQSCDYYKKAYRTMSMLENIKGETSAKD